MKPVERLIAVAGGACVTISAPSAAQDTRAHADVSVGASYSSNPFLRGDEDGGAASVYVQVDPELVREDETGWVRLDGTLRYNYYPDRYGSDETARIGLAAQRRFSERFQMQASGSVQTSRSAAQDTLFEAPSVLPPDGTFPEFPIIDVTVAGLRTRTTGLAAGVTGQYALSPVESISAGLNSRLRYYDGPVGFDYGSTFVDVQYNRRLSELMSLVVGVDAGVANYFDRQIGDAVLVTPTVGLNWTLSETAQLQTMIGVSHARIDLGPAGNQSDTYLAGSVSYCDRQLGGSLCLSASRSARPTGISGVSAVTSFNLGYSRRLSEFDSISASIRYGRTDQNSNTGFGVSGWDSELIGGSATYRRQLTDRLSAFVTPTVSKVSSDTVQREANFGVMAGLTMRFGDRF